MAPDEFGGGDFGCTLRATLGAGAVARSLIRERSRPVLHSFGGGAFLVSPVRRQAPALNAADNEEGRGLPTDGILQDAVRNDLELAA